MSDNVININGKDHNIDTMSDQEKVFNKTNKSFDSRRREVIVST